MAGGGGGGGGYHPSTGIFKLFLGMERAFLQTTFLAVGSSLGHLSMKKNSDLTYRLGSKIRQREGAEGLATTPSHRPKVNLFFQQ